MNCIKNNINLKVFLSFLTASFFAIFVILFFTTNSFSQETCSIDVSGITQPANTSVLGHERPYITSLPECKNIASGVVAKPGLNCLYDGKPLCGLIPSSEYSINPEYLLLNNQIHRYNCHDLIDLQTCDDLGQSANSRKNCVLRCSQIEDSSDATLIRSQDYAVHNRDCIRFCDEVNLETSIPSTITPSCAPRFCHQLGVTNGIPNSPSPEQNCTLIACNLLYKEELAGVFYKLSLDNVASRIEGNYCNGKIEADNKELKCYKFSQEQLPYLVRNKMCVMHNCKPECTSYISQSDVNGDGIIDQNDHNDTLNISSKGSDYSKLYSFHINNCYELDNKSLCNQIICKPIVKKHYICDKDSEDNREVPNNNCDISGEGSNCSGNYCYKTIDCNLEENSSVIECSFSEDYEFGSTSDDDINSWFYRPKPLPKATEANGIIKKMAGNLCYSPGNFENDHDWGVRRNRTVDLGPLGKVTIDLGYFHSHTIPDRTRSPGMCESKSNISGNTGFLIKLYPYLCFREDGKEGDDVTGGLYQKVASHTAYHKGYVKTTFLDNNAIHKLRVCLRFTNALRPDDTRSETCGSRECAVSCGGFVGGCFQQNCGYDVCKDLQVEDLKPDDCKMDQFLFNNIGNKGCLANIGDFLRIRVQKYGDHICSFLDVKGQTAHEIEWFAEGNEVVIDNYCIDGDIKGSKRCSGKNTKDDPASAEKWRTIKFGDSVHIPYIENNQPDDSPQGYLDKDGQLFLKQNCIRATLRKAPLDFYNVANASNSPKLFVPPIYIANVREYRGGYISVPASNTEKYGTTSFHYPEIEVRFGDTSELLSLGVNYSGEETEGNQDPLSTKTIETTVNSVPYSEEIFVKKEYDQKNSKPIFCLYQKRKNLSGTYLSPFKIGCVDRYYPEINNIFQRMINPTLKAQKLVISAYEQNTYDNSFISLRYLADFGTNNNDENCLGDDVCTPKISLNNLDISSINCNEEIEGYKVCAKRDSCSQLNIECMTNEIDMQNATLSGNSTSRFMAIRNNCNKNILPLCNYKKGLNTDSRANIYQPNPEATPDEKAYGWFNEICLSDDKSGSAFDHSLKDVLAHAPSEITNNVMGKCIINQNSPYLTDNNPDTNCDDGGFAPNCLCILHIEGLPAPSGVEVRKQTAREAGLCIDMPKPETCDPIIFNPVPNPDPLDPDYIEQSLGNISGNYGTTIDKVHVSHQLRTQAIGHAEFLEIMMGVIDFKGECKGFWKNRKNLGTGIEIEPSRSCINQSGTAVWSDIVNNHCIRYTCPQISTNGIYDNGNYQGGYGLLESGQNKGLKDGFALWQSHLQTTDFAENSIASSCIVGFRKSGSTPVATSDGTAISGYNGGILPNRICNQLGVWQATNNNCQRIKCSPVNVPTNYSTTLKSYQKTTDNTYISKVKNDSGNFVDLSFSYNPSNPNPIHQLNDYSYTGRYSKSTSTGSISNVQWAYWIKSGGAIFFDETPASRSNQFIENTSKTFGYCNRELGFFQAGTQKPTLECDHLGNWEVKNKCVTRCDMVAAGINSEDENNGFSSWIETDVAVEEVKKQVSGSCITSSQSTFNKNHIPYPYPPLRDINGESYKIYDSSTAYINFLATLSLQPHISLSKFTNNQSTPNTIPADVKNDSRTYYTDPSDNISKWLQIGETTPTGSTNPTNYPSPTRLCKWVTTNGISTSFWQPADSRCITGCPSGAYDPRINVGVTKHAIYDATSPTKTKEFYISWPQGEFGRWVYKTNLGFSNDSPNIDKTASDFSNNISTNPNGRVNGQYVIARKCGTDGKWEDAIPQCATNSGSITESNAIYNSETRTGTSALDVGSVIGGSSGGIASSNLCRSGYYKSGSDTGTLQNISRYSCEYHNSSKNIDQVYFKKIDGEPCKRFCKAGKDEKFGNAIHTENDVFLGAGKTLTLKCQSDFGKAFDGDSSNFDNSCGRNSTDRTTANPYIACSTTGEDWVSRNPYNNCYKCRDCSNIETAFISSKTSESTYVPACRSGSSSSCSGGICWVAGSTYNKHDDDANTDSCGSNIGNTRNVSLGSTMLHDQYRTASLQTVRCQDVETVSFGFHCLDGKIYTIKRCSNSSFNFSSYTDSGSSSFWLQSIDIIQYGNGLEKWTNLYNEATSR